MANAHELNQHLAVLQIELDLVTEMGQTLDPEMLDQLRQAVDQMTERIGHYQQIVRFETTEEVAGRPIIDLENAARKLHKG